MATSASPITKQGRPLWRRKRSWAVVAMGLPVLAAFLLVTLPSISDFVHEPFAYEVRHGYVWLAERRVSADPALLNALIASSGHTISTYPLSLPPVFVAAVHDQLGMAKMLLAHGAKTTFRHRHLLDWTVWHGQTRVARWLVAHGFKESARAAAGLGDVAALRRLVRRNPRAIGSVDHWGDTPLVYAVAADQYSAAKWLLKHGASPVLPKPARGLEPLFIAAHQGYVRLVVLLASFGAPLDMPNTPGLRGSLVDSVASGSSLSRDSIYFFQGVKVAMQAEAPATHGRGSGTSLRLAEAVLKMQGLGSRWRYFFEGVATELRQRGAVGKLAPARSPSIGAAGS